LLKIDSALTLISFAGRDDADGLFFAIFILHAIYVDNQQHRPLYGSNRVPPLFASRNAILAEDCLGIVENECRTLESDATVLLLVDPALLAVPIRTALLYKLYNARCAESTALSGNSRRAVFQLRIHGPGSTPTSSKESAEVLPERNRALPQMPLFQGPLPSARLIVTSCES
jgi:hypothetical protein